MSLVYLFGRYGASALTLVALSLYTRLATPAEYGTYALVMALASALYAALGQWLRHVLLRFVQSDLQGSDPLPAFILQSFIALCVLLLAAYSALHPWLHAETRHTLELALPLFAVMGCFELALAWLQLQLRSAFYVSLSILRTGLAAVLGIAALHYGFGATGLVIATALAYCAAALPVFISTRFGIGRAKPALAHAKSMLAYGLPLAISAALGSALALADRALIAALISTEAAGLYAAPYDLATRTLQVLMLAINLAGTPLIIRAFESGDHVRADALLNRQWILLIGAGLPVTLGMMLMPQSIAAILLGASFRQAGADLMPLVALATFLQGIESFYFSFAFSLTKKPLRQTAILCVATIVNISLTLWWVPVYGIRGGAWATLASAFVVLCGSVIAGLSLRRLPIAFGASLKIVLAAISMALLLVWFHPQTQRDFWIAMPMAFFIYTAAILILDVAGLRHYLVRSIRSRFLLSRSAGGIS